MKYLGCDVYYRVVELVVHALLFRPCVCRIGWGVGEKGVMKWCVCGGGGGGGGVNMSHNEVCK